MKLILEFSEFNFMRLNGDTIPQAMHVDNPQLSLDGYDRFDQHIKNAFNRLNSIYRDIAKTKSGFDLRKQTLIDVYDINKIKILRIYTKEDIFYDVYISFEIQDKEYYGVLRKLKSKQQEFLSEAFSDPYLNLSYEWIIRAKGNIIKTIKNWLIAPEGKYKALSEQYFTCKETGKMFYLKKGDIFNVLVSNEESHTIEYKGVTGELNGRFYIYFNYYNEPLNLKE